MHRPREIFRDKEKVKVRFVTSESTLDAFIYPSGSERVLDVLNNDDQFIPIDVNGQLRIVNKSAIIWLIPEDEERMKID